MVGRNISLKNPLTPPGIDPRTIRLVAQRLNHYTTPGPFHRRCTILNSTPTFYNTYPVPGLYVQLFILCQQNMLWCQCFWSLLPSAGNKFIFFKTYLTECTNFLQRVKHNSLRKHIRLKVTRLKINDTSVSCWSTWQSSVLHTFLNHLQWSVTWIHLSHSQLIRFLVYMASKSTYIEIKLKQKQMNTTTSLACDKVNENSS
jgi:hypothetical protein